MSFKHLFKRLISLTLTLAVSISFIGCDTTGDTVEGVGFRDSLGNAVRLDGKPMRVAVLFSSLADMWQLAGGEVSITVGQSVERGFSSDDIPQVHSDSGGVGKSINVELLLAQKPDFVICTPDYPGQLDIADLLCAAGIPTAYFRLDSFSDYLSVLKIMTDITGNSVAYEQYGVGLAANIAAILESVPERSPRVLFARATKTTLKAKPSSAHFAADMLRELGANNIAEDAPLLLDGISIEQLIVENPEYIFISLMGDSDGAVEYVENLFGRPEWQALDAVRNKKYIFLSKELFQYKPCAKWDEAYRVLYEYLYE